MKKRVVRKSPAKKRERPGEYVGFRSPPELKQKIEAAAAKAGRSLSSEAQFRLEQSFSGGEDAIIAAFKRGYGLRAAGLTLLIAEAMNKAGEDAASAFWRDERDPRVSWLEREWAYLKACEAVFAILLAAKPTEGSEPPPDTGNPEIDNNPGAAKLLADMRESGGRRTAIDHMQAVTRPQEQRAEATIIDEIALMLGPIADRFRKRLNLLRQEAEESLRARGYL